VTDKEEDAEIDGKYLLQDSNDGYTCSTYEINTL
jgi:hypothetical protein